jgi:hypothetical protein
VRQFDRLTIFIILFVWATGASAQDRSPVLPTDKERVLAEKVGKDVETALMSANSTGLNGLALSKAVLTLEIAGSTEGGVKANFFIFTIDHTTKKGSTITQTLTFGALQRPASGGNIDTASLKDSLAGAIASASSVAAQIKTLPFAEGSVKLQFVVDNKNGGSISYKILGIDLGPSVSLDKASTNTLEVTFAKPH